MSDETVNNTLKAMFEAREYSCPPTVVHVKKVSVEYARKLLKQTNPNGLLVVYEGISTPARKEMDSTKGVELFKRDDLLFNVTEHEFVPPHRLLPAKEVRQLLVRHRTTLERLPKILRTDPVNRFYGGKPGDVYEIQRNNEEGITYRVVVE